MKQLTLVVGKTYKLSKIITKLAEFNITNAKLQRIHDTTLIKFHKDSLMLVFEHKHNKLKYLAICVNEIGG